MGYTSSGLGRHSWKAKVGNMEKWLKCTWCPFLKHCLVYLNLNAWPYGNSLYQLTEEEMTQAGL